MFQAITEAILHQLTRPQATPPPCISLPGQASGHSAILHRLTTGHPAIMHQLTRPQATPPSCISSPGLRAGLRPPRHHASAHQASGHSAIMHQITRPQATLPSCIDASCIMP